MLTLAQRRRRGPQPGRQWEAYEESAEYRARKIHADAWCAAFVWPLQSGAPEPPINGVLRAIADSPSTRTSPKPSKRPNAWQVVIVSSTGTWSSLKSSTQEAAMPEPRARKGGIGGFSCMLGNPPWERVKLQEQEFFAARDPDIAKARNESARGRMITALQDSDNAGDRALHAEFLAAMRHAEGESAVLRTLRALSARRPRGRQYLCRIRRSVPTLTGPARQIGRNRPHWNRHRCNNSVLFQGPRREALLGCPL